jgi:hypothetical protein
MSDPSEPKPDSSGSSPEVTLIAAVILGLLAMLPGGYAPESAFLGLAVGVLVLVASRPNRAISRLGSWALFGGLIHPAPSRNSLRTQGLQRPDGPIIMEAWPPVGECRPLARIPCRGVPLLSERQAV